MTQVTGHGQPSKDLGKIRSPCVSRAALQSAGLECFNLKQAAVHAKARVVFSLAELTKDHDRPENVFSLVSL